MWAATASRLGAEGGTPGSLAETTVTVYLCHFSTATLVQGTPHLAVGISLPHTDTTSSGHVTVSMGVKKELDAALPELVEQ